MFKVKEPKFLPTDAKNGVSKNLFKVAGQPLGKALANAGKNAKTPYTELKKRK